jgi:pilus assembly protein CpaB
MTRLKAVTTVAVIALVLAGVASWLVYDYLSKKSEETEAGKGKGIVVATADIPVGSKLNQTHLKMVAWPAASIPPGSFNDTKALIDRISIRPVGPGEPLTEAKLMPKDGAPGAGIMTYIIPDGHRAVTVAVNEVAGVAGFLSPHNKVDVVLTTLPPGSNDPNATISKIVLQNVPILATGQITEQKDGKPVVVPTVTLDMIPDDAEKLVVASSKGSLQMLLRSIKDTAVVESRGATISKVLGSARPVMQASAPRAAAPRKAVMMRQQEVRYSPPSPVNTIEIIKGTSRTSKQY